MEPSSSEPAFSIRRLKTNDIPDVALFEAEIARISFAEDPVTESAFHERRLAKFLADHSAGAFVAESATAGQSEPRVVGWALVTPRQNFVTKEVYGELRSLYVAQEFRTAGVVFALMRKVLEFSAEFSFARVVARTSFANRAMRTIYEGYGFAVKHVTYELQLEVSSVSPVP